MTGFEFPRTNRELGVYFRGFLFGFAGGFMAAAMAVRLTGWQP